MRHGAASTLSPPRLSSVSSLAQVIPRPSSRAFFVAQTGAGKSTISAAALEEYHRTYPGHYLWIVDLKGRGRYYPVERLAADDPLFPEGIFPREVGGRMAIPVVAAEMGKKPRFPDEGDRCTVVHSLDGALALCRWLYTHSDVRHQNVVYFDETIDLMRGDFRASDGVRRLSQHGRELGVGVWHLNQMPSYIDRTWITEATQLYIGRLANEEDREKLARHSTVEGVEHYLTRPLPRYEFLYIDQEHEHLAKFRLGAAA